MQNKKNFTVNVALAAKRILRFSEEPEDKPPLHYACHWENRIGHLVPGIGERISFHINLIDKVNKRYSSDCVPAMPGWMDECVRPYMVRF